MKQEHRLICMMGLPRAGKSTIVKTLGFPIVNGDSIRLALHGQRFQPEAEDMVHAIAKIMVRALFLAGHPCVVVDETNTTRKRRDFWKSEAWTTEFFHIQTDREECIRRAELNNDPVIIPVIHKMADQFEPLGEDENAYEDRR